MHPKPTLSDVMAGIQEESERHRDSNEDIGPVKLCGGVANQNVENYPPLKKQLAFDPFKRK